MAPRMPTPSGSGQGRLLSGIAITALFSVWLDG
jgi:hypothetical protein